MDVPDTGTGDTQVEDARAEAVGVLRQAFDRVPDESMEALRRAADEASSVGPSVLYRPSARKGCYQDMTDDMASVPTG